MKWTERIRDFAKSEKGGWILLAAGVIGILLILFTGGEQSEQKKEPIVTVQAGSMEEYAEGLEQRLQDLVKNIAGAGECRVMVTVETGMEYVYAQDVKDSFEKREEEGVSEEKAEQESEYLLVDGGALLITEKQPEVKGAVVVCRGAANPAVQQRVLSAVTTALGVSSAKVCVTQME